MRKNTSFFMFYLFVFLFCSLFVLVSDKTYMKIISKSEIVYLEDLSLGDFLETGSYITTSSSYRLYSEGGSVFANKSKVCFSKQDDDSCDSSDTLVTIQEDENYTVSSNTNHKGWKFKNISYDSSEGVYYLLFVPADSSSGITQIPDVTNAYEIKGICSDNKNMTYNWYTDSDVDISSSLGYKNKDIYAFDLDLNYYFESSNSFEIEASAGEVLNFDFSAFSINDESFVFNISLNGEKIISGAETDHVLFENINIPIKKDGKQKISFDFGANPDNIRISIRLKNFKLLKGINADAKLDSTNLVNGTKLYYTGSCSNNMVDSGTITYTKATENDNSSNDKNDNSNSDNSNNDKKDDLNNDDSSNDNKDNVVDDEESDNPGTGAFVSVALLLFLFIGSFIIWIIASKKMMSKV